MDLSKVPNIIELTETERSILHGIMIGDGTGVKRSKSTCRFRISQRIAVREYVDWLYTKLKRLCTKTKSPTVRTDKKGFQQVEFYLDSGRHLMEIYNLYYILQSDGSYKKHVPVSTIDKIPMNPLVLATLWMDDGSVRNDAYSGKLASQGFTLEDQKALQQYFDKWGIVTVPIPHLKQKNQFYLSFPAKTFGILVNTIEPILIEEVPCMRYKLNEERRRNPVTTEEKEV